MITYQLTIKKILAQPDTAGKSNVVRKVFWQMTLTDGVGVSYGGGETVLNVSSSQAFVPFEVLTAQQIVDWVIESEGGEAFVNMLKETHAPFIEQNRKEAGLVEVPVPQ